MSLTATYDPTLARVQLTATGVGTAAYVTFERSLNGGTTWTSVRCGVDAPIVSGSATIYDYEFASDVLNTYRVTSYATVSFVSVGTASHAVNANVTPGLPAGAAAGDLLLVIAAHRDGSTAPNVPAGYVLMRDMANMRLFGKIHSGSEVAPTITFTGSVPGEDTSAQMAAFRGATTTVSESAELHHIVNQQDIPFPALTVTIRFALRLWLGWKQDDWTSVATIPGATEIDEPDTATGTDQGMVWDFAVDTALTPTHFTSGSFVVTGGANAYTSGAVMAVAPTSTVQTTSITPMITDLWIKSIGKPFLNRTVTCLAEVSDFERGPRHGIFEVINRNFPVAVTDVHQSREGFIRVVTETRVQADELDLIIASGEPLFFHTPANHVLPSMHVVLQRTSMKKPLRNPRCDQSDWRVTTLPWREIAAPSADVCGATITWQGVVNTYASWQAVIDGETSWADLLTNIGEPGDVLVP